MYNVRTPFVTVLTVNSASCKCVREMTRRPTVSVIRIRRMRYGFFYFLHKYSVGKTYFFRRTRFVPESHSAVCAHSRRRAPSRTRRVITAVRRLFINVPRLPWHAGRVIPLKFRECRIRFSGAESTSVAGVEPSMGIIHRFVPLIVDSCTCIPYGMVLTVKSGNNIRGDTRTPPEYI